MKIPEIHEIIITPKMKSIRSIELSLIQMRKDGFGENYFSYKFWFSKYENEWSSLSEKEREDYFHALFYENLRNITMFERN